MAESFEQTKQRFKVQAALVVGAAVVIGSVLVALTPLSPRSVMILMGAVVVVALFFLGWRMGGGALKARRAAAETLARQKGYHFEPTVPVQQGAEFLQNLNGFALFSHERGILGKRTDDETDAKSTRVMDALGNLDVTNRTTGTAEGLGFQAFDYRYSPIMEERGARRTTVIVLETPGRPAFRLTPRSSRVVAKLFDAVRGDVVELPDYPHFTDRFTLRSADVEQTRTAFNNNVIAVLEVVGNEYPDLTIESDGKRMLVYRFGEFLPPDVFPAILAVATRMANSLG